MSLTVKKKDGTYPHHRVRQEVRTILKIYPDFVRLVVLRDPFSFDRHDWSESGYRPSSKKKLAESPEEIQRRAEWRARTKIQDLALSNDFDLFMTFTFKNKRYDADTAKKRMGYWLNNQRAEYGSFRYVIAPEYHKDKALHFHALFGGYLGKIVDRGHVHKGRKKYDVDSYQLGIATAKKIDPSLDDHQKVAGYVSKYITKDMPKFHGRHRYWCSIGLKLPLKILNPFLSDADKAKFTEIKTKSEKLSIFEFRGQLPDADILRFAAYGNVRDDDLEAYEL